MEGSEMSQMQISLWLQCLFLFSLIWSVGGTMNGDSRIKFDHFFRTIITGTDTEHPRPKSFKLGKVYTIHVYMCMNELLCMFNVCIFMYSFNDTFSTSYYLLFSTCIVLFTCRPTCFQREGLFLIITFRRMVESGPPGRTALIRMLQ